MPKLNQERQQSLGDCYQCLDTMHSLVASKTSSNSEVRVECMNETKTDNLIRGNIKVIV